MNIIKLSFVKAAAVGAALMMFFAAPIAAEVRSGFWTWIDGTADSVASRVDFSNFTSFCQSMGGAQRCSLKVADCSFRYDSIFSPNGIYCDSSLSASMQAQFVSGRSISGKDRLELFYLDSMMKKTTLIAPQSNFRHSIPGQSGVFFIKTAENRNAVMIKLGQYIGGIDRTWYYWAYQPDSSSKLYRDRLFDLPDTLKIAADVFSGRPNPVFSLTDSAGVAAITHGIFCSICTFLDSTIKRSDTAGCPGGLGYRLLSVSEMFPQDNPVASYKPYINICQGKIEYKNMPASAPRLYDKGSQLEKLIIRVGCEKNLSVTDQYGTVKLCDVVPDSLKPSTSALQPGAPGGIHPAVRCRVRSHELQFESAAAGRVAITCFSLGGKCMAEMMRESDGRHVLNIDLREYSIGPGAYIVRFNHSGMNMRGMIFPVFIYH
jgi:hypothetical protein